MKLLRKITVITVALIMLISAFSVPASAVSDTEIVIATGTPDLYLSASGTDTVNHNHPHSKYSNTSMGKKIVALVKKGIENLTPSVDISSFSIKYLPDTKDKEEIENNEETRKGIMNLVQEAVDDNPECFPVASWSCTYSTKEKILKSIKLYFYLGKTEYQKQISACRDRAEKIIADIDSNLPAIKKAMLVHDRLAVFCEYDRNADPNAGAGDPAFNLYGALGNGLAVCQGYAEAYSYICRKLGLVCYYVASPLQNHAWNIILIDGKYYYVDVTWDDPQKNADILGRVTHDYFLKSYDAFGVSHYEDDFTTTCTAEATDKTYDEDAFWENSETEFCLISDDVYFIDNVENTINLWNGNNPKKADLNCDYEWAYSRLCTDGKDLYYSAENSVIKYSPSTGISQEYITSGNFSRYDPKNVKIIYATSEIGSKKLFGFTLKDNRFFAQYATKQSAVSDDKIYSACINKVHTPSDGITFDREPTCVYRGLTCKHCTVCGEIILDGTQETTNPVSHSYIKSSAKTVTSATCISAGKRALFYTCRFGCGSGYTKYETIAKVPHKYVTVTKKANFSTNGYISNECDYCGKTTSKTKIYAASKISLSKYEFSYNGKTQRPSVKVKDAKGNKISTKYYTITKPSSSKKVGKYSVKVKLSGRYSGTITLKYTIRPKNTKIKSLTMSKNKFTVKWKKVTSGATGYQVQYSRNKNFSSKKTVTLKGTAKYKLSVKKLKSNKRYFVRVRTYKTVNGDKYYSYWSGAYGKKTK